MKRLVLLGMVALLVVACGSSGGSPITGVAGPTTAPKVSPGATTTTTIQSRDKGFVVVSLDLKPDAMGFFGGTAQVENDGTHGATASVRFTFKQNGKIVGTADGVVNNGAVFGNVAVGQRVPVNLNSIDKWDGSPVTYSFQVTTLY